MTSAVGCQFSDDPASRMEGVAINCLFRATVQIKTGSIVDHCIINVPLVCQQRTILSHCHIEDPQVVTIPEGWLFHTAALMLDGRLEFVTIAFQVDDDIKGPVGKSRSWSKAAIRCPQDASLWKAKLFQSSKESMAKSFVATWKEVCSSSSDPATCQRRYSMEDIVKYKNIPTMLENMQHIISQAIKSSS